MFALIFQEIDLCFIVQIFSFPSHFQLRLLLIEKSKISKDVQHLKYSAVAYEANNSFVKLQD